MSQQTRDPNSTGDSNTSPAAGPATGLNGAPPAARPEANPDELQFMWGAVAALLDDVTVPPGHSSTPGAMPPAAPPPAMPPAPLPAARAEKSAAPLAETLAATEAPPSPAAPAPSAAPQPAAEAAPAAAEPPFTATPQESTPARQGDEAQPAAAPPEPLPLPPWEKPAAPAAAPAAPAVTGPAGTPAGTEKTDAAVLPPLPAADAAPAAVAPSPPSEAGGGVPPEDVDFSAVSIRGRSDGLTVEIGAGKWDEIITMLAQRLDQSGGFFRNAHVAVETGDRGLNEQDLKSLSDLLARHEIVLGIVRTISDRTFHSAIALGLAVVHESPEGSTLAAAQVAAGNAEQHSYYVYRGSLRSGQVLDRSDHVIVVGDVNPGAQVISDGDILVWGRLRGMAHAGANGNSQSVIAALDLDPIQLRIDTVIAATPGGASENRPRWYGGRSATRRPEIARLIDHQLVIEEWDEAKVHGANILKRRRD